MDILWFLLGLAIGLLCLGWCRVQLDLRLKRLIRDLEPDSSVKSLPLMSQLSRAIAANQQVQRSLVQELEAWQQTFQSAPIGFLKVDEENQLLWCNAKACQLLDIQQCNSFQPRLLLELVRSYELDDLIEQTRTICQSCQRDWIFNPVCVDQSRLSRQQPRPLRAYSFPLENGAIGVFLENRQEAVLLAQQRNRWTSDVAHELKTPLTSIRLVAETLQSRLEPPLKTWVERMLQETIRLSNLVQDLLDLSHLDAHSTVKLTLKSLDFITLLHSAWASLEPLARQKLLQLDYEGPDSILIQADEARLHRVLLNLLDNSIKYSPSNTLIYVRVHLHALDHASTAQQIHLEVIDSGPGFPDAALPFVFDRFYRVDPSRTRNANEYSLSASSRENTSSTDVTSTPAAAATSLKTGAATVTTSGSGLGLAIVRQIVEAHHGYVEASNHPKTCGAWIQVFLPLKQ